MDDATFEAVVGADDVVPGTEEILESDGSRSGFGSGGLGRSLLLRESFRSGGYVIRDGDARIVQALRRASRLLLSARELSCGGLDFLTAASGGVDVFHVRLGQALLRRVDLASQLDEVIHIVDFIVSCDPRQRLSVGKGAAKSLQRTPVRGLR